ncbi:maleylacetoacetate isomerase [Emergomyces pasteurianus Ep9510]|uniref:Maleylacetoacetate isomerase n=1 Tax=Emergomyces pasteurianus Ep9510 TaxID=1447872 RepID=A0A1J9PKT8_9EURO|nr:maleylacetoacetate isomerase [Emergomyces pasteurianus Ep9510]
MASEPLANLKFHLYSYFRSSCAGRLRIALNLKQIPYTTSFVNLLKGDQLSATHRALNPSATVPVLTVTSKDPNTTNTSGAEAEQTISIGQSVAALEYLEELFTNYSAPSSVPAQTTTTPTPLLPPLTNPQSRAHVRTLVNIIACDIQPVTNLRIQKRVKALDADNTLWARELMVDGFAALEAQMSEWAGEYCVGDAISLADVCLVPAVWAAQRIEVDLTPYPTVSRVFERLEGLEAIKKAHWSRQPDTPEELRSGN